MTKRNEAMRPPELQPGEFESLVAQHEYATEYQRLKSLWHDITQLGYEIGYLSSKEPASVVGQCKHKLDELRVEYNRIKRVIGPEVNQLVISFKDRKAGKRIGEEEVKKFFYPQLDDVIESLNYLSGSLDKIKILKEEKEQ